MRKPLRSLIVKESTGCEGSGEAYNTHIEVFRTGKVTLSDRVSQYTGCDNGPKMSPFCRSCFRRCCANAVAVSQKGTGLPVMTVVS